jgi:hypothetical protein
MSKSMDEDVTSFGLCLSSSLTSLHSRKGRGGEWVPEQSPLQQKYSQLEALSKIANRFVCLSLPGDSTFFHPQRPGSVPNRNQRDADVGKDGLPHIGQSQGAN